MSMCTIGGQSRQAWIELCQKARIDPPVLVQNQIERLFRLILDASASDKVEAPILPRFIGA